MQERLSAIRAQVDRACSLLISPNADNLDHCSQILEAAVHDLSGQRDAQPDGGNARRLHSSVLRAAFLLERAAAFHSGWRRILGTMCGGYRADGGAAPAAVPGSISVEG